MGSSEIVESQAIIKKRSFSDKNISQLFCFSITFDRGATGKVTYTLSNPSDKQTKPPLPQRLAYLCLDGDIKLEVPYSDTEGEYISHINESNTANKTFEYYRKTWPDDIVTKHVVFLLPPNYPTDAPFTIDALALTRELVDTALIAANDGTFAMEAKTTAPH